MIAGTRRIPVARPATGEAEVQAARRAIESGWITLGPETAAFEQEFAAAVGTRFACAVSSGTAALHVALLAIGVQPDDEVITASHSFIATANSVRYCRALPVFVDIDPTTFNMVPAQVEAAITPRTRAILCVHQVGMPCDLAAFVEIARRHGIALVEDAACASGSEICWNGKWERIGQPHGQVACFSFHPRKVLTTGDGGMLTTNDAALDQQFRLLRHHGMSVPAHERHTSSWVINERYDVLGYNYRLTDIQAAIGREQVRRLPDIIRRRRQLGAAYHAMLRDVPGLEVPFEPAWARSNWQSYTVRLADGLSQGTVMQRLWDNGVATRRGVMCAHREPAYPPGTWRAAGSLRESERAQDRTFVLPLYPQMTDDDQQVVVDSLKRACVP